VSRQLPVRPNLEQLKKQSKSLLKAHQEASPDAFARIRQHHPRLKNSSQDAIRNGPFTLADAQLVLAREYGFASWTKLRQHILNQQAAPSIEASVRALRDAAGKGDLALLASLLDEHPELINEPGGPGVRTALHQAVFGSSEPAVRFLLERGADPNIRCEGDNAYPLHFACEKNHFPIIRLLIEHGADPIGEGDYHELDVIGWATAWVYIQPNKQIVDYLLAHGARHNIYSAVAMGETSEIRRLVAQSPADLERRMELTNRRCRPLHLAVAKKQPASLTTLLDLGANTESLDEARLSALDQAALHGETSLAQILLDRGAKIRLPAAIALQRTPDIEKLLRRDPDALRPGGRWANLIIRASERSPGSVIDALLQAGASVDVRDDPKTAVDSTYGYTALHAAAFHGNLGAASVLLKHGANVRIREEKYHGTPAGWADYAGHTEVRDLILRDGPIDIIEAVQYDLIARIQAILDEEPAALHRPFRDYPLFPLDAEGWYTPLAYAVARGKTEMVQFLLARAADSALRSPEGHTLVDLAHQKGHASIAAILDARAG
jgi:ankyrin repeat protein